MPASYKEGVQNKLDNEPGMTFAVWQQRPDSTGFVKARSTDPSQPPEIQPNYLALEGSKNSSFRDITYEKNYVLKTDERVF